MKVKLECKEAKYKMLKICEASVTSADAVQLMQELSDVLEKITGSSGKGSFKSNAMEKSRAAFFIAYMCKEAIGCGAIYEYSDDTAEIKRVYSRNKRIGVGGAIISALEGRAREFGYHRIILETRKVNHEAVRFYLQNGYQICPNYGKYAGRDEAVCFAKNL